MEGTDQVRDMLKSQLALIKPSNWAIAEGEDAAEANGVVEAWITFETDVARGFGHHPAEGRARLDFADDDGRVEGP